MKLEMMAEEDVELRVRLETDPQMMAELGGPRPREAIERAHAKSLALAAEGRCWPLKIIPDGGTSPAGAVDVFESSHEDEAIYEIGWMILPEFQNRGIASQAVREVLEKARGERKFGQIHAFPAVTNGPSNKICEKNGFTNLSSVDGRFAWYEGKGDRTQARWLDAHTRFFNRQCTAMGLTFSDDIGVVFERFELVWPTIRT